MGGAVDLTQDTSVGSAAAAAAAVPAATAAAAAAAPAAAAAGAAAAGAGAAADDDEAFARALQAELDAAGGGSGGGGGAAAGGGPKFPCILCTMLFPIGDLYVLDACSHKACRPCMSTYVAASLAEKLADEITCPTCDKPLSIRDIEDFTRPVTEAGTRAPLRAPAGGAAAPSGAVPTGSKAANRRLLKELASIQKQDPAKLGFSVALVGDNLYEWDVKVFGFDKDGDAQEAALAGDMARLRGEKAIVLRVVFPSMYPAQPPYLRVIRPRFQFRTGHVTVGGSICIESLTQSGWSMSMTFESVILTVRQNMIAGGGRLDLHNRADYDAREAKVAFDRLKRVHGWL